VGEKAGRKCGVINEAPVSKKYARRGIDGVICGFGYWSEEARGEYG